jgi:hypothetical protein
MKNRWSVTILSTHHIGTWDTVLNEQGSGRRILSDALHRRPGVVKNEQGSSHLTRPMRRVRKLAETSRLRVGTWNVVSLMGKL